MTGSQIVGMKKQPGVARDGTRSESNSFAVALWTRWQRTRPRKMWGYKAISSQFTAPSRGTTGYSRQGIFYVTSGAPGNLEVQQFDVNGNGGTFTDRTPAGLVSSSDNVWQFGLMYDGASDNAFIVAHTAPNLTNIDNNITGSVFVGDAFGTGSLTTVAASDVSGGICVLYPYLFAFGSDGDIRWSVPNTPSDFAGSGSGDARVTGSKIVSGFAARGGAGVSPAGIFFALDALIRATFAGGAAVFDFDRIAEGYSILSSRGPVEYGGIFYWPGQDCWLAYNGVVQEVPNDYNMNFFFDNLNFDMRQKVWGVANPRWGEIWWFAPLFGSTECNWAIVYNVREKTWYDTPISRISGVYSNMFRYPVWFDDSASGIEKTKLWMHEFGLDQVDGANVTAVQSYVETSAFSLSTLGVDAGQSGQDLNLEVSRIDPDFITNGEEITITFNGRKYQQSPDTIIKSVKCSDVTEKLDFHYQARQFQIRVESNVTGGDVQWGIPTMTVASKDVRP